MLIAISQRKKKLMANKLTIFSIKNQCVCVWWGVGGGEGGGGGGGGEGIVGCWRGFDFTIAHSLINLVPRLHIYYSMILL